MQRQYITRVGNDYRQTDMAPSFVKAFTSRVSTSRRRELKYKVMMAAANLLVESRTLYAMSCKNPIDDVVDEKMDDIGGPKANDFLRRCRCASKTQVEKQYVSFVIRKHVLPPMIFTFKRHIARLRMTDRLNVLNDANDMPRFLVTTKMANFNERIDKLKTKLKTQLNV